MRLLRAGTAAALAALIAACDTTSSIAPTAQVEDCARCHGDPPPPPHTASTQCSACHPGTVEQDNVTIIPGGLHMNGVVDVAGGAGHPLPYLADHPAAALAGIASCTACHGADYGGGTAQSCNACHARDVAASTPDWKQNCTFCHGTRTANVTTATAEAAPPEAVAGATATTEPRVGAHQAHLAQGTVASAMPCASCHAVPSQSEALTHFSGNGARGAVAFSTLATKGVTGAAYSGGTCTVYCHGSGAEFPGNAAGAASPAWTSAGVSCTSCHGNPPASGPTISGQPAHAFHVTAGASCATCHPVPPGQRASHVNGTKDVVVQPSTGGPMTITGWDCTGCHAALGIAAGHAVPYVADHTSAALSNISSCTSCHGADYGGGSSGVSCNACHADRATYPVLSPGFADWKANCTFCHGTRTASVTSATPLAAPPQAVVSGGDQTRTNPKVGAHQAHLGVGTYRDALPCSTCHSVPSGAQALTHFTGGAATVAFDALSSTGVTSPSYAGAGGGCTVYCHGSGTGWPNGSVAANRTPPWTSTGLACNACHGLPPSTGRHDYHVNTRGQTCSRCHDGYTGSSVDKALHVDGVRDVIVIDATNGQRVRISGWDCTTCHNALGV